MENPTQSVSPQPEISEANDYATRHIDPSEINPILEQERPAVTPTPISSPAIPAAFSASAPPQKDNRTAIIAIIAVAVVALVCICACTAVVITALMMIPTY